jgi:hypothetical protein
MSQRGLAALGRRQSANRARLLGYGGVVLSFAGYYSAGDAMFRRALNMAEKLGDEGILGHEFSGIAVHRWAYMQMRDAADSAAKGTELLRRVGNLWLLVDNLNIRCNGLFATGRLEDARAIWHDLQTVATRVGRFVPGGDADHPSYIELLRRVTSPILRTSGEGDWNALSSSTTRIGRFRLEISSRQLVFGAVDGRRPSSYLMNPSRWSHQEHGRLRSRSRS